MYSDQEIKEYCDQRHIPQAGFDMIQRVRKSNPSRVVQGRAGNVTVDRYIDKMEFEAQAESHTLEDAGVISHAHNPATREFYTQPVPIKISYIAKSGRATSPWITLDLFVIEESGAGWEEYKHKAKLLELCEEMPNRYTRDENGKFHSPPAESFAASLGLFYRIRTEEDFNWIYLRNLDFTDDYTDIEVSRKKKKEIIEIVKSKIGITLEQLRLNLKSAEIDDFYSMILKRELYFDWEHQLLSEPTLTNIYLNETIAKAYHVAIEAAKLDKDQLPYIDLESGEPIEFEGNPFKIANVSESIVYILPDNDSEASDRDNDHLLSIKRAEFSVLFREGKIRSRRIQADNPLSKEIEDFFIMYDEEDFKVAFEREEIVLGNREATSLRTKERYQKAYKDAEVKYGVGYGFLGLLRHDKDKGKKGSQLDDAVDGLIENIIVTFYENPDNWSIEAAYEMLKLQCKEKHLDWPVYQTFYERVKGRDPRIQDPSRIGQPAADSEVVYHELSMTVPQHGDRPFHVGHIDHTQLEVEVVDEDTGENLGRPWLTLLIDAYTRLILAFYISFDPPSYRSIMMVMRECVRRHGKLTSIVFVDGGREFRSLYFDNLRIRYKITKKTRPWKRPHFGTTIERSFGMSKTQFYAKLRGNTQLMKNPRKVTKKVNPKTRAIWQLEPLYDASSNLFYEIYPNDSNAALRGLTPNQALEIGMARSGQRKKREIPYNFEFLIYTYPSTRTGKAKVEKDRGVKINYIYYWCEAMKDSKVIASKVKVRFDPYNMGIAFAYINGKWELCKTKFFFEILSRITEKQLKLITAILRQQMKNMKGKKAITAQKIAEFIMVCKNKEVLLQIQRDSASEQIRKQINTVKENNPDTGSDPSETETENSEEEPKGPYLPDDLSPYGEDYHG